MQGFATVYMTGEAFILTPDIRVPDGFLIACTPCFQIETPTKMELSNLLLRCLELSASGGATVAELSDIKTWLGLKSEKPINQSRFAISVEINGKATIARPMLRLSGRGGHSAPTEDIVVSTSNSMPYEALRGAIAICRNWQTEGA